jgi:beta-carotene hydroxylase
MSMEEERAIARNYIGGFPWFMVIWGLGGFGLWLSLFPLVHLGHLPIWLGCLLATIICCYCYLPSHEAQHGNIGRPNKPWRWLNELVGHTSGFPIMLPYRLHRAIHLRHHGNANDPARDPDIYMQADTIWGACYNAWWSHQPGKSGGVQPDVLDDNPHKNKLLFEAFLVQRVGWIAMALLCWSGLALETLLLWWIPAQIAAIYTPVTLSWAPHHPMAETGRYRDTRSWKSPVGTILSAGMEYHIVHHLFPSIPLNKTPAAYRALKPLMTAEDMRLHERLS